MRNKEIEEILEGIKVVIKHDGTLEFDTKELKILLNYITNLQSNWNSLREWLKNKIDNFQDDVSEPILHEQMTIRVIYEYMENLDKMNELEGE